MPWRNSISTRLRCEGGRREEAMDPRVEKMAGVLVGYSIGVKPGDWAVVSTSVLGEPLANACARAVVKAGGTPTVLLSSDETEAFLLRAASPDQLPAFAPSHRA